jgi:two-component system sensor histidine kinase KdpD
MKKLNSIYKIRTKQLFFSVFLISLVALCCYFSIETENYRIVAMILLMTVSIIAIVFDFITVIISAFISALIWNYFFIPPIFTFHIANTEDNLMFILYFFVVLMHAVLSNKIKHVEKKAREKEEKERIIALYNTLLNSLSHELRTPISTIISSVDFLKENKNLKENELTTIYKELDFASIRLNKQVENLLNMSRLDSGMLKAKLDWIDISDVINKVINSFGDFTDRKIFYLQSIYDIPLYKTDGGILEQIIYNILHNAIEHTPFEAMITIEVHGEEGQLNLILEDNGNGFPEEELDNVFEKFYRLSTSKTGGVGLGLSIVKGLTEALNGTVKLENKVKGARFTIEIPCETLYPKCENYDD